MYVELASVLGGRGLPHPPPERPAARPHVHGHVEHLAPEHGHQLALCVRRPLQMQAAQDAVLRIRHVVLHKLGVDPSLAIAVSLSGLDEPPALVTEHTAVDAEDIGDRGRRDGHFPSSNRLSK